MSDRKRLFDHVKDLRCRFVHGLTGEFAFFSLVKNGFLSFADLTFALACLAFPATVHFWVSLPCAVLVGASSLRTAWDRGGAWSDPC